MSDDLLTYEVQSTGWIRPRHRFLGPPSDADGGAGDGPRVEIGVLEVSRDRWGVVSSGRFQPEKGEVLFVRRDPGLLRSQFSLWTEGREWLASTLRWHVLRREVQVHTGSKPLRILPLPGFHVGWQVVAPKTGQMAAMHLDLPRRRARIEVFRRMDFEVLVFTFFVGRHLALESIWPGPDLSGSEEMIGHPSRLAGS